MNNTIKYIPWKDEFSTVFIFKRKVVSKPEYHWYADVIDIIKLKKMGFYGSDRLRIIQSST